MENLELQGALEGILFASGDPMGLDRLCSVLAAEESDVLEAAQALQEGYLARGGGIRLIRLENALQLCSAPEYASQIRLALEARKPPQLSQSAMEVLAVVAYYQPVTKAYIEQIRGVDCSYTVNMLLDRGFIEQAGRLSVPGRPVLYATTDMFLRVFGISSVSELPPVPEAQDANPEQLRLENAIAALSAELPEQTEGGEEV